MEPKGWVLFDGDCGFCLGIIHRMTPWIYRQGFDLAPLQEEWVQNRLQLSPNELLQEMRVLTSDDRVLGGADAWLHLLKQNKRTWPLYIVGHVPGIHLLLNVGYRWVARNRYRWGGGTCTVKGYTPPETLLPVWIGWLPLIALPSITILYRTSLIPWVFMWALSISIWLGFKWLTWWQVRMINAVDLKRSWAYFLLWPGMDADDFLLGKPLETKPTWNTWLLAWGKTILGAALFWGFARLVFPHHPLIVGWIGLFGLIFLLHFGTFHLIALFWQTFGIAARPIMKNPFFATSLSDFWSHRWNLAFRQLAHRLAFHPLHKRIGPDAAMFVAFLGSGLIHDLVISLPAQGGYGLPAAYFVLQGVGLAVERSTFGRSLGLGKGFMGWAFTLIIAAGPAFWLFHPPFVTRIVVPFMAAMGAI